MGAAVDNPQGPRIQASEASLTLSDHLLSLIRELDRVHPDGAVDWGLRSKGDLPNFATAANGSIRLFTPVALEALSAISNVLYDNDQNWAAAAERSAFQNEVRRCVADLHAEGRFQLEGVDVRDARLLLRQRLQERLQLATVALVHHIPCWTVAVLPGRAFTHGPVTLRTVADWIDWVDFQQAAHALEPSADGLPRGDWKDLLKNELAKRPKERSDKLPGLAGELFSGLEDASAIATVTVPGYQQDLSKKVARAVCQSTLDCLSLASGSWDLFVHQVLASERVEPYMWSTFVGTPEGLGLPGRGKTKRVPRIDAHVAKTRLARDHEFLDATSSMIDSLLEPTKHPQPELANRWLTALEWLAEGFRERNDAIAVAKVGAALDVLSNGGKAVGIATMLSALLEIPKSAAIIRGPGGEMSLARAVSELYEFGRSQILHGTHYKLLKRFEEVREVGALIVPMVLKVAAVRLSEFKGADEPNAFRTLSDAASGSGNA